MAEDQNQPGQQLALIEEKEIKNELEKSYLSYAMSVIIGRAIPDIRDGLKPVHRRIIYSMYENGFEAPKKHVKCATIVGGVMGNYHPHGDASIYDALVRMAQPFSLRVPLIDPQGNFGSIDGDNAAAMRYTEARLAPVTKELVEDLKYETVSYSPNFDDRLQEPNYLPAKFPNILVNGSNGIAVGMSTNILPHNLKEVMLAVIEAINVGPNFTWEDIYKHIKGPDFPTGGTIIGTEGIKDYIKNGEGKIIVRAKYHIEQVKEKTAIIVTEIPYTVNKAALIEKIAEFATGGKIQGIHDLRDESDRRGMRIYIELKKSANAKVVINNLFKHTAMERAFTIKNLVLTHNGKKPEVLSVRDIIAHFIAHRLDVITKRTLFLLRKRQERLHIVEGRKIAISNIDDVVQIIKQSSDPKDAKIKLISKYAFSELQADDILEMKLSSLTKLKIDELIAEEQQLLQDIAYFKKILADENEKLKIIKEESENIITKYSDPRKTEIDLTSNLDEVDAKSFIEDKDTLLILSKNGYLKRVDLEDYKKQQRGGKGKSKTGFREEDQIQDMFQVSSHDKILLFTNNGTVFVQNAYDIPIVARTAKGSHLAQFIQIKENDKVVDIVVIRKGEFPPNKYIFFATAKGQIKKTALDEFSNIRSTGIRAITLQENDELVCARLCENQCHIALGSNSGMVAHFEVNEESIRTLSRSAQGVRGIRLSEGEMVVDMVVTDPIKDENELQQYRLLTVSKKGYGKITPLSEYRLTNRAVAGVRTMKISESDDGVVSLKLIDNHDIIIISEKGNSIRISSDNVREIGRNTKGVRLIKLEEGDYVSSIEICEPKVKEDELVKKEMDEIETLVDEQKKEEEKEYSAEPHPTHEEEELKESDFSDLEENNAGNKE
jgi:DNA gyrase subunit A